MHPLSPSYFELQLPLPIQRLSEYGPTLRDERDFFACRYARYLIHALEWRQTDMAKAKLARGTFEPVEFVQMSLTADDEEHFRKWEASNNEKITGMLDEFMADGHKVGITFDASNACFIASATCKDEKNVNYNRCVTARSDAWWEALELLLYKHIVKAKSDDWSAVSRPAAWG